MLQFDEALKLLLEASEPHGRSAEVAVAAAVGRVSAEAVAAPESIPAWDNSAMDGYAVIAADLAGASKDRPVRLEVIEHIPAGSMPEQTVRAGTVAKIMTGAPVPKGADAVVKVEDTDGGMKAAEFYTAVERGNNIRPAGNDVKKGKTVLAPGEVFNAGHLALFATLGIKKIRAAETVRVAVVTTGTEVSRPSESGGIRDSNGPMLEHMVRAAGGECVQRTAVTDKREDIRRALEDCEDCDILVTTGGVSAGDYDFVPECAREAGFEKLFHKTAIKPGKPVLAGKRGRAIHIGLPGNPVSAFVGFHLFVAPVMRKLAGRVDFAPRYLKAALAEPAAKKGGRIHFDRGTLATGTGGLTVTRHGNQSSGALTSVVECDCLVVLPSGEHEFAAGDLVDVLVFNPGQAISG